MKRLKRIRRVYICTGSPGIFVAAEVLARGCDLHSRSLNGDRDRGFTFR
jgi:hypothetical protein